MHAARRPAMRALPFLSVLALGCRTSITSSAAVPSNDSGADIELARQLLCADVGEDVCRAACPDRLSPREGTECLLAFRFASDPIAHALARDLYGRSALVGIGMHRAIDGFPGEEVELFPALPLGDDRRHLAWLQASLTSFDAFVDSLARHAPSRPLAFEPRPRAFAFYRTAVPAYPSAYCWEGVVAYNLDGPMHTTEREVLETLFHELFHVNDARRKAWSERALGATFDAIIERCGDDHDCYRPFAPHDTLVAGGTFYGFDWRTRDVREYGAELALRYFLEHEAILAGAPRSAPSFKCLAPENRTAWDLLAREFFGGADLTCCES
jgi:hypothetical protein